MQIRLIFIDLGWIQTRIVNNEDNDSDEQNYVQLNPEMNGNDETRSQCLLNSCTTRPFLIAEHYDLHFCPNILCYKTNNPNNVV